jgi:anti-anti-sigma regulatory factor
MSRASGQLRLDEGAGPFDHGSWAYSSDDERAAAAAAWLVDGLRCGQRAFYVAEGSVEQLMGELSGVPDLAATVESGALVVVSSNDLYDLSAPIDADGQLAVYARAVEDAIAAGYGGLRVASDITPLVEDPLRRQAHVHWEQVADRYMTDYPLAPLCMYDTRRIDDVRAIECVHPLQGPHEQPFTLYGATAKRSVLRGEVDAFSADVLAQVLRGLPATDEVIDVSLLFFVDGRGAWTLHDELTRRRAAGQVVTLSGPSKVLRHLWHICGFDESAFEAA